MLDNVMPAEKDVAKIFTPEGLPDFITSIEKEARAFQGDMSTAAGRKEIASAAHKVAKTKVAIDDLGKDLVADLKAKTSAVDAQRKIFRDRMDVLKEEVRAPLTQWEETEEARIAELNSRLKLLDDTAVFITTPTAEIIEQKLSAANALYQYNWEEIQPLADEKYEAIKRFLDAKLEEQKKYEAEQTELKRLREQTAEREKKDREDQIAREAADAARKIAEEKAETERKRVEDAAKIEANRAENARLEAEAKAKKAEEDRLAAIEKAERDKKEAAVKAERERKAEEEAKIAAEQRAKKAEEELKTEIERAKKEETIRMQRAYDSYGSAIKDWAEHNKIQVSEAMILDLINRMMVAATQKQKKAA